MEHRPEYDIKQIGRNLKRFRKAKNLSIDEIREYLRLGSVQAVYKYERGENYPPADAMFALMELYEISLGDLLYSCEEAQETSLYVKLPDLISIDMAIARHCIRVKKYRRLYLRHTDSLAG